MKTKKANKTRVRLGPAGRAILLGEAYQTLAGRRWLIHNSGVELELVGGPYETQKQFANALIARLSDADEGDTFHIMTLDDDGPGFSEFSSRFMDYARAIALAGSARLGNSLKKARKFVYEL